MMWRGIVSACSNPVIQNMYMHTQRHTLAACSHMHIKTHLTVMRSASSARMTRSKMSGEASSESSHVLCMEIVLTPPMKISLVYSSRARFESATYGTYLITTT